MQPAGAADVGSSAAASWGAGLARAARHGLSVAALAAGGGPADCRLQRRPAAVGPLQGASGAPVRMRGSSLHEQHTEQCGRTAATKDLPAEFLGSGTSLLGAQWGVTRKGDGSCYMHAEFCPSRTSAPGGMRSPALPAAHLVGALLTPIPGSCMILGGDDFINCVCLASPGHHGRTGRRPPANTRWVDIVAVLPRLELAAAHIVAAHASAKPCIAQDEGHRY